jgi:hypothetical protein
MRLCVVVNRGQGMGVVCVMTPSLIRLCTTRLKQTTQMRWMIMTQDERLDRIEAMLRFIIRELTYIPETDSMPEKPNLVRVK